MSSIFMYCQWLYHCSTVWIQVLKCVFSSAGFMHAQSKLWRAATRVSSFRSFAYGQMYLICKFEPTINSIYNLRSISNTFLHLQNRKYLLIGVEKVNHGFPYLLKALVSSHIYPVFGRHRPQHISPPGVSHSAMI